MDKIKIRYLFLILLVLNAGCKSSSDNTNPEENMIHKSELSILPGKKVYFAHQSVGYNITEGMKKLIETNKDLDFIRIISLDDYLREGRPADDSVFYFIHSGVGKNMFPETKIADFRNKLENIGKVDAAFLKFCFIDINRKTDVNLLYKNYINVMSELKGKYKNTRFLYFTCPLTTRENFVFGLIKAILQRPDDLNKNRHKFNSLVRATNGIDLFDLAFFESHDPDEASSPSKEFLLKKYATPDGGHLNETGSEKIALQLLIRLNLLMK